MDQEKQAKPAVQLQLRERIIAAAGASIISALVVNPIDLVKTRMQAHAAASSSTSASTPTRRHICQLDKLPVRPAYHSSGASGATPSRSPCGAHRATSQPSPSSSWPRISCCSTTHDVARRMRSALQWRWRWPQAAADAAAAAATCAHAPGVASAGMCSCMQLSLAEGPYSQAGAHAHVRHVPRAPGMLATFRGIVQQEGVRALWRGLDSALLASLPVVGVYMPLYDHLQVRLAPEVGSTYAPVVAGMGARAVAVFFVAPLELIRTRQQAMSAPGGAGGGSSRGISTLQALRSALELEASAAAGAAAGASSSSSSAGARAGGAGRVLRALPNLWTGFGATMARDLPFSGLYWGLVEPMRAALLARASRAAAARSAAAAADLGSSNSAGSSSSSPGAGAVDTTDVLLANLIAGSVAGACAAALTTPFDVIKTRLQIAAPAAPAPAVAAAAAGSGVPHRQQQAVKPGTMSTMRSIVAAEGVGGLFTGVGARAARAAPACAIVIASYELLKVWL